MNKELIQQIMGDEETRCLIADTFGQLVDDAVDDELGYDDLMVEALSKLKDTLVKGDMITIEVSDHIWVRGKYVRTLDSGRMVVDVPELTILRPIHGKRVDLVVKGEEGRGKPDLVGTGVQKGIVADAMIAERIKPERSEMSE